MLGKTSTNPTLGFLYSDIDFVFERNAENCPGLKTKFIEQFSLTHDVTCNRIVYEVTEHQTFSVLIKSNTKTQKASLIVYNHGHNGLPSENEEFAYELMKGALNGGADVLIVSMPFTGIDRVNHDFGFKSWDGWAIASASLLKTNSSYLHGILELYDSGQSHFIRYFVDNAVVTTFKLLSSYSSVSYVGLSGGATTGLYTCALLKDWLDSCILVAGVMPANLRNTPKTFGDAEQISGSLHKRAGIFSVISDISKSKTNLTLQYNSDDGCCFPRDSANEFRAQVLERGMENVKFTVRDSSRHDYDPKQLLSLLKTDAHSPGGNFGGSILPGGSAALVPESGDGWENGKSAPFQ